MAILNDIRALFAQCPALKDLEARTDQLETDAEGYGILPCRFCRHRTGYARSGHLAIPLYHCRYPHDG